MSRTLRKNSRWFTKVHGEYYTGYCKNTSMKFHLPVKDLEDLPTDKDKLTKRIEYGKKHQIVKVGDGDNLGNGYQPPERAMMSQIDRSRAKQALSRAMKEKEFDYETLEKVKPAFDPWAWD